MKKSAFLIIMVSAGTMFLMLFQNCGQMEAKGIPTVNLIQSEATPDPIIPDPVIPDPVLPDPVVVDFGPRFALDAVSNSFTQQYDLFTGDKILYETDYMSSTKLTLVTMYSAASIYRISISGDSCEIDKALEFADLEALVNLLPNFGLLVSTRVMNAGDILTPDCAFPRFGMDGVVGKADYEVYFSDLNCVPNGKAYSTEAAPILPPFYNGLIDKYCSAATL